MPDADAERRMQGQVGVSVLLSSRRLFAHLEASFTDQIRQRRMRRQISDSMPLYAISVLGTMNFYT